MHTKITTNDMIVASVVEQYSGTAVVHTVVLTEEHKRLIESFITWCSNNHLKLSISKTNGLVVSYHRNRRPPVTPVTGGPLSLHDVK